MVKIGPRAVELTTAAVGFGLLEAGLWRLLPEAALIGGGLVLLIASLWRPAANE